MKRIVHILYSGLGGHSSVVFGYLSKPFLEQYEHKLLFFGVEDLNPEFAQRCEMLEIDYFFIKKHGVAYPFKISSQLKKLNADLVLCHSLPLVPILSLLKGSMGFKLILVEHASIQLKRSIDLLWTSMAGRKADRIIYLNSSAKEEAIQKFKLSPENCNLIPNGIDLESFKPTETKNACFTIFSHGRIIPIKRLDILLKAVKLLSQEGLEIQVQIAGAGEGLVELKRLRETLKLEDKVQFLGMKSETEIRELLAKSHVYVNSSEIESMSTALIQAMASGLACIVSDIKGNTQIVQDSENGLYFPLNNSEALAKVLTRLYAQPELLNQLGENARQYAKKYFSKADMSTKYANLAAELVG